MFKLKLKKIDIDFLKYNIIIIFLIIIILEIFFLKEQNIKLKICVCTIAKKENLYIKEFIEHYKRYGVDKIFEYDNNEINGEKIETILANNIKNGFVEIINYRGFVVSQVLAYNDCYKKNNILYNWFIFYDIDEFIYLKNYKNIKSFLNSKKFDKCQKIELNWFIHTDNNQLYYENKSLEKRFPEKIKYSKDLRFKNCTFVKSIIKGNIKNLKINDVHGISNKLSVCNGFGRLLKYNEKVKDFKYNYIDHYLFKSTSEFINKLNRTDACFKITNKLRRIKQYFMFNKITLEKIKYIENKTKINLSMYKNFI